MRLGIVGSSSLMSYERFEKYLALFAISEDSTIIASNCTQGSDRLSERYAKEHKLELEIIPTEWTVYQSTALVRRNIEIAEKSDFVLFFCDYKGREYASIVRFCVNLKVPFSVIFW